MLELGQRLGNELAQATAVGNLGDMEVDAVTTRRPPSISYRHWLFFGGTTIPM